MKQYLIAIDLEGIHGVVGEPYSGLEKDIPDYKVAVANAEKELNAAIRGLFDSGADTVAVWDNHGDGVNLDFSHIDSRVIRVYNKSREKYIRFGFLEGFSFDGVLFMGYHPREGSLNGVLAHTYSSAAIQYYKVNGRPVGELDIDAWAAANQGIPALFLSSDAVGVQQAKEALPHLQTVITKTGQGRNTAIFRDEAEVLQEIYEKALQCAQMEAKPIRLPVPAELEVRFTRMEDALKKLNKMRSFGLEVHFGEDAHILRCTLKAVEELEMFLA